MEVQEDDEKFFIEFAESRCLNDPLPLKVEPYSADDYELIGQVRSIALLYLQHKNCPEALSCYIANEAAQEVLRSDLTEIKNVEGLYEPLKLMYFVTSKVNDKCLNSTPANYKNKVKTFFIPVSFYEAKNGRRRMEDRHVLIDDLNTLFGIEAPHVTSYYAVFDGHAGSNAASYCAMQLHGNLVNSSHYLTNLPVALEEAFLETDKRFFEKNSTGGTTALVAVIRNCMLYIAWAGDSQAILVKNGVATQLVDPHVPSRADERERIENGGGYVLYWGTWRVNGQLALSRAIGDRDYKPYITAKPEILQLVLNGEEDCLILACDGLWDTVNEDLAVEVVRCHLRENPGDYAGVSKALVRKAKGLGSCDNISVITVFFRNILKFHSADFNRNTMDSSLDQNADSLLKSIPNELFHVNGCVNDIVTNTDMLPNNCEQKSLIEASTAELGEQFYKGAVNGHLKTSSELDSVDGCEIAVKNNINEKEYPTPEEVSQILFDIDNIGEEVSVEEDCADDSEEEWKFVQVEQKPGPEIPKLDSGNISAPINPINFGKQEPDQVVMDPLSAHYEPITPDTSLGFNDSLLECEKLCHSPSVGPVDITASAKEVELPPLLNINSDELEGLNHINGRPSMKESMGDVAPMSGATKQFKDLSLAEVESGSSKCVREDLGEHADTISNSGLVTVNVPGFEELKNGFQPVDPTEEAPKSGMDDFHKSNLIHNGGEGVAKSNCSIGIKMDKEFTKQVDKGKLISENILPEHTTSGIKDVNATGDTKPSDSKTMILDPVMPSKTLAPSDHKVENILNDSKLPDETKISTQSFDGPLNTIDTVVGSGEFTTPTLPKDCNNLIGEGSAKVPQINPEGVHPVINKELPTVPLVVVKDSDGSCQANVGGSKIVDPANCQDVNSDLVGNKSVSAGLAINEKSEVLKWDEDSVKSTETKKADETIKSVKVEASNKPGEMTLADSLERDAELSALILTSLKDDSNASKKDSNATKRSKRSIESGQVEPQLERPKFEDHNLFTGTVVDEEIITPKKGVTLGSGVDKAAASEEPFNIIDDLDSLIIVGDDLMGVDKDVPSLTVGESTKDTSIDPNAVPKVEEKQSLPEDKLINEDTKLGIVKDSSVAIVEVEDTATKASDIGDRPKTAGDSKNKTSRVSTKSKAVPESKSAKVESKPHVAPKKAGEQKVMKSKTDSSSTGTALKSMPKTDSKVTSSKPKTADHKFKVPQSKTTVDGKLSENKASENKAARPKSLPATPKPLSATTKSLDRSISSTKTVTQSKPPSLSKTAVSDKVSGPSTTGSSRPPTRPSSLTVSRLTKDRSSPIKPAESKSTTASTTTSNTTTKKRPTTKTPSEPKPPFKVNGTSRPTRPPSRPVSSTKPSSPNKEITSNKTNVEIRVSKTVRQTITSSNRTMNGPSKSTTTSRPTSAISRVTKKSKDELNAELKSQTAKPTPRLTNTSKSTKMNGVLGKKTSNVSLKNVTKEVVQQVSSKAESDVLDFVSQSLDTDKRTMSDILDPHSPVNNQLVDTNSSNVPMAPHNVTADGQSIPHSTVESVCEDLIEMKINDV